MAATRQFATFTVGGLYFGVDVLCVQEVIRYHEMTRVPTAPALIQGLINLRGQIVTAIDIRWRLQLPPRPPEELPMNVVIRADEETVSLLVDEIGDVIDIEDEAYERPPDNLKGVARSLVTGVYKLKERLLLVLDTERAIALPAGAPAPANPFFTPATTAS